MAIFNTVYGGEKHWEPNASRTLLYLPLESDYTDQSGNSRTITKNNTISYSTVGGIKGATGGSNGSLSVSGTFIPSSTSKGTLSVRFYITTSSSGRICEFANQNNNHFALNADSGKIRYYIDDANSRTATIYTGNMTASKWQNVIVTMNGSSIKIYLDGVLQNTITSNVSSPRGVWPSSSEQGQNIFCNRDKSGGYWGSNNYLRELIMENVEWSSDEVSKYYNYMKSKLGL